MLPFQAELYRAIFRITSLNRGLRKIVQDKAQGSGREGAYFVYATERTGSCNAAMANFFRITSHNRGLRKICRSKAWGSVNERAHFVCVTEFTGSHNAAPADFPQSDHSINDMAMALIFTV